MLVGVRSDKAMPGSPESNGEWRGRGEELSRRPVCGGVLRGLVQEGMDSRMALGKTVEGLMRAGLSCHLGVVTDHSQTLSIPKGLPRLMAEMTYSKLSSRHPGSSGTLT